MTQKAEDRIGLASQNGKVFLRSKLNSYRIVIVSMLELETRKGWVLVLLAGLLCCL